MSLTRRINWGGGSSGSGDFRGWEGGFEEATFLAARVGALLCVRSLRRGVLGRVRARFSYLSAPIDQQFDLKRAQTPCDGWGSQYNDLAYNMTGGTTLAIMALQTPR
eukprot:gene421-11791_t